MLNSKFAKKVNRISRYVCDPNYLQLKLTRENGRILLEFGVAGKAQAELYFRDSAQGFDEVLWAHLTEITQPGVMLTDFGLRSVVEPLQMVRSQLGLLVWARGQPRPDNRW